MLALSGHKSALDREVDCKRFFSFFDYDLINSGYLRAVDVLEQASVYFLSSLLRSHAVVDHDFDVIFAGQLDESFGDGLL